MTTMTLEQAISSVQVRNEMRGKSGEYPNGEGWGHCWREDGYWIPKDAWKVIDAHLATGAQVEHDVGYLVEASQRAIPFLRDEASKYDDDGSNEPMETIRDIESAIAMLSQRGEVE